MRSAPSRWVWRHAPPRKCLNFAAQKRHFPRFGPRNVKLSAATLLSFVAINISVLRLNDKNVSNSFISNL